MGGFIIPFGSSTDLTYLSLNISFRLRNAELRAEMLQRQEWLRGMIFERLIREINRVETLPSLDEIKTLLMDEVNLHLTSGRIHEVYVTDFLIV
jgi:flagellar basal body-associated protein FliL